MLQIVCKDIHVHVLYIIVLKISRDVIVAVFADQQTSTKLFSENLAILLYIFI